MSYDAFKVWSKFSDTEYLEKFCHFSGESSEGETSVSKPILKKNWKKPKKSIFITDFYNIRINVILYGGDKNSN